MAQLHESQRWIRGSSHIHSTCSKSSYDLDIFGIVLAWSIPYFLIAVYAGRRDTTISLRYCANGGRNRHIERVYICYISNPFRALLFQKHRRYLTLIHANLNKSFEA